MQVKHLDTTGKEIGQVELNAALFGQPVNEQLLAQYIHVHRQRRALGTKKTKSRGEVSGGGHKPWRQKGTGKARHGSIRSPLWVGGGHAHHIIPTTDKRIRMSRQMRMKALYSALSWQAQSEAINIIDIPTLAAPKTKIILDLFKKVNATDQKVLVVTATKDENIEKSVRNIAGANTIEARLLNPVDVLLFDRILIVNEALPVLEEVFLKHAK